jgi:hypothetical protein
LAAFARLSDTARPDDFDRGLGHDASMRAEWLWAGDWRLGAFVGVEALCMGLFGYALFENVVVAALYAAFMTVVFAVCLIVVPRQWRGGRMLNPADRRAVAHAVFRGEEIDDARLVAPTLDLARVVLQRAARERRRDWSYRVVGVLFLVLMTPVYLAGPDANALAFVTFVLGWSALILGAPILRDRRAVSAGRAYTCAAAHDAAEAGA